MYRRQPLHPVLYLVSVFRLRQIRAIRSPLVPLKQIPRVHLVRHVRELVAPAVGDDHVAAGLEGLQVVGHLGAEELQRPAWARRPPRARPWPSRASRRPGWSSRTGHRSRASLSGSISPAAKSLRMGLAATMAPVRFRGTYL